MAGVVPIDGSGCTWNAVAFAEEPASCASSFLIGVVLVLIVTFVVKPLARLDKKFRRRSPLTGAGRRKERKETDIPDRWHLRSQCGAKTAAGKEDERELKPLSAVSAPGDLGLLFPPTLPPQEARKAMLEGRARCVCAFLHILV